jgi:hypothetical protein
MLESWEQFVTLLLSSRHVKLYSINSHSKTLLLLFGQSNDIGASLDLACTPSGSRNSHRPRFQRMKLEFPFGCLAVSDSKSMEDA